MVHSEKALISRDRFYNPKSKKAQDCKLEKSRNGARLTVSQVRSLLTSASPDMLVSWFSGSKMAVGALSINF